MNTTVENNKLIGEFMGLEQHGDYFQIEDGALMEITGCERGEVTSLGYMFTSDQLKYHQSWDWLMPVIEKARQLKFYDSERLVSNIDKSLLKLDLIATYRNLVDFIKWYNQQDS